jgi:hypothetical protein
LAGSQITQILQFSLWTPAESWWIAESIRVGTAGWKKPQSAFLYNALLREKAQGQEWLEMVPPTVRGGDWVEAVEDVAKLESVKRSVIRVVLGAFRRLPLSPEGLEARKGLLAALPLPPPPSAKVEAPTIVDLLAGKVSAALCRNLRDALRDCWRLRASYFEVKRRPETTESDMANLSQAISAAEAEVVCRFEVLGRIRLLSGDEVDHRMTAHWGKVRNELVAVGEIDA